MSHIQQAANTILQKRQRRAILVASVFFSAGLSLLSPSPAHASGDILNASYDVTRELFKDINPAFVAEWKKKTGESITINQSHGGSSKQARSVIDGLEAGVVTMNQASDIDILAEKGLVPATWNKAFPNNSAPFYSTMVFLTRKGNPKKIASWEDLGRADLKIIIPNPKLPAMVVIPISPLGVLSLKQVVLRHKRANWSSVF